MRNDGMNDAAPAIFLSSWSFGTMPSTIPQTLLSLSITGPPQRPSGSGVGVDVRNLSVEANKRFPLSVYGINTRVSSSEDDSLDQSE